MIAEVANQAIVLLGNLVMVFAILGAGLAVFWAFEPSVLNLYKIKKAIPLLLFITAISGIFVFSQFILSGLSLPTVQELTFLSLLLVVGVGGIMTMKGIGMILNREKNEK
jgi:hypothetical protein